MAKNIMRKETSIKTKLIGYSILFVLVFLFISFIIYGYLDYSQYHKVSEFSIDNIVDVCSHIIDFNFTLSLSSSVIVQILKLNLNIWYVYVLFLLVFWALSMDTKNNFRGMEHGSADWMSKGRMKFIQKEAQKTNNKIPIGKDFYVSTSSKVLNNLNELVIGGSGAGKSFRKIKPDILQMNGSYIVTDPKGELYRDCAKVLKKNGYKVKVLNLVNLNFSNSYNPFSYITSEQDVVDIASLFMKNTAGEGEKEDFFSGAAQKLLIALMMYLYKSENEIKTFGRVVRLVNSIRYKNGAIDMSCELARCLNEHATKYPYDIASTNWGGMQGNAQETQSSINEVLSTRLSLFATTDLDAITSTDEMDFDSVGVEKTAIFLIIPSARNTYKVVCNIFYSQFFERLRKVADLKYDGCMPLLVSCEMDEFANIGEIPAFENTLAVARSYNLRICIVLQGLSQLKAIYEKTYESIIGNCNIFTLLGTIDNDTLQYVSDKLGKITVRNDSKSFNRGSGSQMGGGGQDTEGYGERPLLYPDEIKEVIKPKGESIPYGGKVICFLGYERPLITMKFDTINHPLFAECGSKYKEYVKNNTYIDKEFAPIWEQRLINYEKMYSKHEDNDKLSKEQYDKQKEIENKETQERLSREFEEVNNCPPPVNDEVSDDEYIEYSQEADNQEYNPVPDYANEDDIDPSIYDETSGVLDDIEEFM